MQKRNKTEKRKLMLRSVIKEIKFLLNTKQNTNPLCDGNNDE